MIRDVEENDVVFYKASKTLWEGLSQKFEQNIVSLGVENVQAQEEYNNLFSYILPYQNLQTEIPMWLYYTFLKSRDKFRILEKTKALPSEKYDYFPSVAGRSREDSRVLNWDYLITIDTIQTIAESNPKILQEPVTICEIGAGWGRIAYYLTQVNPKATYCVFDIPHVLFVSHEYLCRNVHHTQTFDYQESREIIRPQNPGIYFYTPHFLEKFDKKFFDIAINVASFQEMNLSQVEGYFEKVDYLSRMLYTQQRYSDLDMSYEKYPIYKNWKLLIDKDTNFHPMWFEQIFQIQ